MSECFLCADLVERGGSCDVGGGFRITADMSPLSPFHSLVFPSGHDLSLARLGRNTRAKLWELLERLRHLAPFNRYHVVFFEHGPLSENSHIIGCCDHAHVHLVAIAKKDDTATFSRRVNSLNRILAEEEASGIIGHVPNATLNSLETFEAVDYMWLSIDLQPIRCYMLNVHQRQYLRKIIARTLGKKRSASWDTYSLAAARQTMQELTGAHPIFVASG